MTNAVRHSALTVTIQSNTHSQFRTTKRYLPTGVAGTLAEQKHQGIPRRLIAAKLHSATYTTKTIAACAYSTRAYSPFYFWEPCKIPVKRLA